MYYCFDVRFKNEYYVGEMAICKKNNNFLYCDYGLKFNFEYNK